MLLRNRLVKRGDKDVNVDIPKLDALFLLNGSVDSQIL